MGAMPPALNRREVPSWSRYLGLVALAFWLRCLFLICWYPPFEGFDEVMHVGYLNYLLENHQVPVYGEAKMPASVYSDIINFPQADITWRAVRGAGLGRFSSFYDHPPRLQASPDVLLYQAQHPPLFYILAAPLYGKLKGSFGVAAALGAVRMINAALAAGALFLLLRPVVRMLGDGFVARASVLAASLWPMLPMYVIRASNDALAMFFSAAAFFLLAEGSRQRPDFRRSALAGALLGLGTWTKLIAFLFFPAAILYFGWMARAFRPTAKRSLGAMVMLGAAYVLVAGPHHLASCRLHGTPFPAQETIINSASGKTAADLLAAIEPGDAWTFFIRRMILGNLWTSGMTFLHPAPGFVFSMAGLFSLGLGAWVIRAARTKLPSRPPDLFILAALWVALSFAGSYAHALNSRLAWGKVLTPAHYLMPAFPLLLVMVVGGAGLFPDRIARFVLAAWGILLLAAEFHSWFMVAVPYWAHTPSLLLAIRRLTGLVGFCPGPWASFGILLAWIALMVHVVRSCATGPAVDRTGPQEYPSPP